MIPIITILTPTLSPFETVISHYDWFMSLENDYFELVIVDQNDTRSERLTIESANNDNFTYVHNRARGLSKNRNIGVKYARGNFILFLDDDARFDKRMASRIINSVKNSEFDILLGAITDYEGELTSYTPHKRECVVNAFSIEGRVNSNGILASTKSVNEIKFDEIMGVGASFGACEEIDFVVKSIISGYRVKYLPTIKIIHPPKPYDRNKAFSYGRGHGYFAFKLLFRYPSLSCKYLALKKISKCLSKLSISIILFRSTKKRNYRSWAYGFIQGFIEGI